MSNVLLLPPARSNVGLYVTGLTARSARRLPWEICSDSMNKQ